MTQGCADCEFLQHETDGDVDTCHECANEENNMEAMLDQVFEKVFGPNW